MTKRTKQFKKGEKSRQKMNFGTTEAFNEIEEDYYCSSSYSDAAIVFKPRDFKQKLMIAKNILVEFKATNKTLHSGKTVIDKSKTVLNTLSNYTKLPKNELEHISKIVQTRDRSFKKAITDVKVINYPTQGLIADDIRNILVTYIVEKKEFPSKMDLLRELKSLTSSYTNEIIPIQRLVKNDLIKYHHFPEFNRYLLTENPKRVYQRTVYLNNIKKCRLQNRKFVYVEVRRILPMSGTAGFVAGIAAFPDKDLLEKFFTKDSTDIIAWKWLQQRVLPLIESGSIVVFSQPKKRNKVSHLGKRIDMIQWLDNNGIPYGSNPHTAELYSLYQKFKGKMGRPGIYDHIFLNAGLDVIQCKTDWRQLNFFKVIWAEVEVMDAYTGRPEALKQRIINATKTIMPLNKTEENLVLEEMKIWEADQQMELIVENTLEMAKKGETKMPEFPKECCGDKTDHFEMHVGEIILDMVNLE